ncbi:MAG: T9SS type A sorting domain-containing protein [Bacteroidota bacterium]
MKTFYTRNLKWNKTIALILLFCNAFLYSQAQTVTGDVIKTVDIGSAGWVSLVWDGTKLLSQNESDGNWLYIDPNTGATTAAFNNPAGGDANAQGAAWSSARSTIFTLQYGVNNGEVWELNSNGTVANTWEANIFNANRQRGLTIANNEVWIGQGYVDATPANEMLFRFDLDGNALGTITLDVPVVYSRGMEWVNGQLWVNDNGAGVLRVYDYDGDSHTLTQVRKYPRTHWSMWGMAYTGTELLATGWNTTSLYWYKASELVTASATTEIGDTIKSVPGYWSTSLVWDGEYAWGLSEDDNLWHQMDKTTGQTGVTFPNATDALSWAQGAAWSTKNSTIFTNQSGIGTGEVWEIDKTGAKKSGWTTDLGNDIRGLALRNDTIWISVIGSSAIYRFDLAGTRLDDVTLDVPIIWAGGMEWVDNEQLWVNDRDGQHIAIYNYDEEAKTLTKVKLILVPFWSFFDLAYTGEEMLAAGWGTENLYWLKSGLIDVTSVRDTKGFSGLSKNYPNPFSHSTTISYVINQPGMVNLTIYNIQGQKVVELINEYKTAGEQSVEWNGNDNNGSNVVSGIYFYRVNAGSDSSIGKMLLMK